MAYVGQIYCSKCSKSYHGVDHIGNLCSECSKKKEEQVKKLGALLFEKFNEYPDKAHLLFDFLMTKFDNEMTGYLIKIFNIEIERDEIRIK